MHLLIPFASCLAEGCAAALPTLKLPQLEKLLARLTADALDQGDEFSLSPPHERALARTLGLPMQDGLIPWAAHHAQTEGAVAFITPCHWQTGSHQIANETLFDQNLQRGSHQADCNEQKAHRLGAAGNQPSHGMLLRTRRHEDN